MFKKSILTAFLLGLLINIAIQACGEDSDAPSTSNTDSGQNTMPDPEERYKWDVVKVAYEETFKDGSLADKTERTFDDQGRIIKEEYKAYYKSIVEVHETTQYSYSGNTRTITRNRKEYDQDGKLAHNDNFTTVQRLWE